MTRSGAGRVAISRIVALLCVPMLLMAGTTAVQAEDSPATLVATAPASVRLGDPLTVTVRSTLPSDSDALGVTPVVVAEGATVLAEDLVIDGQQTDLVVDSRRLGVGAHTLTVRDELEDGQDTWQQTLQVTVRRALVSLDVASDPVRWATDDEVRVTADQPTSGLVIASVDGEAVGFGSVFNGFGDLRFDWTMIGPGTYPMTVWTSGDPTTEPAEATSTLVVAKAPSAVTAKPPTTRVVVRRTRPLVKIAVTADRFAPTGTVVVRSGDRELGRGTLTNGSTAVRLPKLGKAGRRTFTIDYRGDDYAAASTGSVTLTVARR